MKKFIALMLVALLALSGSAFAATYTLDDVSFEYDDTAFEILQEQRGDDEDLVALGYKNADWGEGFVTIDLAEVSAAKPFPTVDSLKADMEGVDVIQGDWANFKNVISFSVEQEGVTVATFIAPIYDDDNANKIDDALSVTITAGQAKDDQAAMDRDDAISNLVNTLKVIDD